MRNLRNHLPHHRGRPREVCAARPLPHGSLVAGVAEEGQCAVVDGLHQRSTAD